VDDQRLIVGGLGARHGEFRFGVRGPGHFGNVLIARSDECGLQRGDIVGKRAKSRIHEHDGITNRVR
jgi:hypothetical protein